MQHRIWVTNLFSLGVVDGEKLNQDLLRVNFVTLCSQYNLDPAKIEPAKSSLEVIVSNEGASPYFLVKYGASHDRPLFVYEWGAKTDIGRRILKNLMHQGTSKKLTSHIVKAKSIIKIELSPSQLKDMGLLFAYEIARWAAFKGNGLVFGLDGIWYELNRYHAFIPVTPKKT